MITMTDESADQSIHSFHVFDHLLCYLRVQLSRGFHENDVRIDFQLVDHALKLGSSSAESADTIFAQSDVDVASLQRQLSKQVYPSKESFGAALMETRLVSVDGGVDIEVLDAGEAADKVLQCVQLGFILNMVHVKDLLQVCDERPIAAGDRAT